MCDEFLFKLSNFLAIGMTKIDKQHVKMQMGGKKHDKFIGENNTHKVCRSTNANIHGNQPRKKGRETKKNV